MYWLGVDDDYALDGTPDRADARIDRATNTVHIKADGYRRLYLYLNDQMLDLDQPVRVVVNGRSTLNQRVEPSEHTFKSSLAQTGDRYLAFPARLVVDVK